MRRVERFVNAVIVIGAVVLAGSYFLPAEAHWAPVDSWQGYLVGDEFVSGYDVIATEMWSNAVGLVVLVAILLRRWARVCIGVIAAFMWAAIVSVGVYMARLAGLAGLSMGDLWWGLAAAVIFGGVIVTSIAIRKLSSEAAVWTMLIVLSTAALIFQVGSVAFYLVEDGLLLNFGSVAGVSAACVLVVGLTVRGLMPEV